MRKGPVPTIETFGPPFARAPKPPFEGASRRPQSNMDSPLVMDSPVAEEPSDLRCPLTYCLMRDPVTTSMGNTYERGALMRCWMGPRKRDPLTGEEVLDTVLTPNMLARSQVRPRSCFHFFLCLGHCWLLAVPRLRKSCSAERGWWAQGGHGPVCG